MEEDSPYDIEITNAVGATNVDPALVGHVVDRTLRRFARPRATISIALVDDDTIAELNRRFLNHDGPTDVITFDLADDNGNGAIDGEIVISTETADREAAFRGHAAQHEVLLYIVHGLLHLLGMDDRVEADAARMHAIEDEVLSAAGVGPVYKAVLK